MTRIQVVYDCSSRHLRCRLPSSCPALKIQTNTTTHSSSAGLFLFSEDGGGGCYCHCHVSDNRKSGASSSSSSSSSSSMSMSNNDNYSSVVLSRCQNLFDLFLYFHHLLAHSCSLRHVLLQPKDETKVHHHHHHHAQLDKRKEKEYKKLQSVSHRVDSEAQGN